MSALDYYHDESLVCLQTLASCNLFKKSAVKIKIMIKINDNIVILDK